LEQIFGGGYCKMVFQNPIQGCFFVAFGHRTRVEIGKVQYLTLILLQIKLKTTLILLQNIDNFTFIL
jgi:hypothetical protein